MRAVALRCEHREDVPCVDDPAPRLSWALERTGATSARPPTVLVAADVDGARVWDSGRVELRPTRSTSPTPAGRCRPPREFAWTVQVWDEAGDGVRLERARALPHRPGASGRAQWIGRDRLHDPAVAAPAPTRTARPSC